MLSSQISYTVARIQLLFYVSCSSNKLVLSGWDTFTWLLNLVGNKNYTLLLSCYNMTLHCIWVSFFFHLQTYIHVIILETIFFVICHSFSSSYYVISTSILDWRARNETLIICILTALREFWSIWSNILFMWGVKLLVDLKFVCLASFLWSNILFL